MRSCTYWLLIFLSIIPHATEAQYSTSLHDNLRLSAQRQEKESLNNSLDPAYAKPPICLTFGRSEASTDSTTASYPDENLSFFHLSMSEEFLLDVLGGSDYTAPEHCATPEIKCLPPWHPGAYCAPFPEDKCIIGVPEKLCEVLELEDGQLYPLETLKEKVEKYTPSSFDDIERICMLRHEIKHAEDFLRNPGIRSCETEENAFKDTEECFNDHKKLCRELRNCKTSDINTAITVMRLAREYNSCICKEDPTSEVQCRTCGWLCGFNNPDHVDSCDAIDETYCKQERREVPPL